MAALVCALALSQRGSLNQVPAPPYPPEVVCALALSQRGSLNVMPSVVV